MVRVQAENNRASAYRTHSEGASGESEVFSLRLSRSLESLEAKGGKELGRKEE